MSPSRARLVVVALAVLSTAAAAESFDVARFEPPAGFTASRGGDHVIYTRTDESAGTFCQLALYASRKMTQAAEREFAVEWKDLAMQGANGAAPRTTAGTTRGGIHFLRGEATVTRANMTYRSRLTMLQGNQLVLSVLTNASNEGALAQCEPAASSLLDSMSLGGAAPSAAAPTPSAPKTAPAGPLTTSDVPRGKGVAGVWMGMEMPMNAAPYERWLTFYDDGQTYWDVPREGYAGFSREASKRAYAQYWGTYRMTGASAGEVSRPGMKRLVPLQVLKADEIDYDHVRYYRCAPVDGLRLEGAWTSYGDADNPALRGPPPQPVIHFTKDGRFQDDGLWRRFLGIGESAESTAPGAGSYEIKDWTIALHYDDGRTRTAAFTMFLKGKADPHAQTIFIQRGHLNRMP